MTQNAFLAYLRTYARFALRSRKSYENVIRTFTLERWKAVSRDVEDRVALERLRDDLAQQVVMNYSKSDPYFGPDVVTVVDWLSS